MLLLVAYPVALIAGLAYALVNPLAVIGCCAPLMKFLLAALNLPLTCTRNMIEAKQLIVM